MIDSQIEGLARIWMANDRYVSSKYDNPDDIIGQSCSGGTGQETVCYDTEMTGKPKWHKYIPQAEATLAFIKQVA